LKPKQVALVAGEKARNKEFRVELSCPEVRVRLAARLDRHAEEA